MPEDNPEVNSHKEAFVPNMATLDAWEAQAHMLEFRESRRGSEKALHSQKMAQEAFSCVIEATEENIYNAIIGLTKGNVHDANDILQEVYIRAYRYLPSFRGDAQVDTWLHRIMLNRVNSHYKKLDAHTENTIQLVDDADDGQNVLDIMPSTEQALDPYWSIEHTDMSDKLKEAISQLSPKLGRAAVLYYIRDLNYEQIGALLGEAANTVKLRVHRARAKLEANPELKKLRDK